MAIQEILQRHPALEKIKHPCRIIVIGRSQSGKTTLAMDMIQYLLPQVDELIICSPTFNMQETWGPVRPYVTLHHDSLEVILKTLMSKIKEYVGDDEKNIGKKIPTKRLIVLDDVSYEKALNQGNKGALNGLCYNCVWWNITLLVICHKLVNVGAGMRENSEHLLLLNNQNMAEVKKVYDNFGIMPTKKDLEKLYGELIWEPIKSGADEHPFIYVNFKEGGTVYNKFSEKLNLS